MYKVNNAYNVSEEYPFVVIFNCEGGWWYWGSYSTEEKATMARNAYHHDDGIVVRYEQVEVLW